MAYQALYRTYRPRYFRDVAGQTHIIRILKNQVRTGQFSHAYLFCGTRGTGKTTVARILSRALNCLSPRDGEPCGECANCKAAFEQNGDIIEIDAASNTGVDNVRELIGQAQFAPLQLKKRVFIIDEVHMLSSSAFNALLKTLEEPPAHVTFILATTEPQKLPATIISRCQRFDFHRLTIAEILGYLQYVLKQTGASVSPDGLRLIARAAEGGMRDALSLLDQCISFCGKEMTLQDVEQVLGVTNADFLFTLTEQLFSGDTASLLGSLDALIKQGKDLSVFAGDLLGHLRALLLSKACGDCPELLNCTEDQMARYQKQAKAYSEARLLYAMDKLIKAQGEMRYTPSPRILLESALVRIARPEGERSVDELSARVAALEDKLRNISALPAAPAGEAPTAPAGEAPAAAPTEEEFFPEPPPEEGYLPEEAYEGAVPEASAPESPPKSPPKAEPKPKSEPKPKAEPKAEEQPESEAAQTLWKQVLSLVQKANPLLYRNAAYGQGILLTDRQLTVAFPEEFSGKLNTISSVRNVAVIQGELSKLKPEVKLSMIPGKATEDVAELVKLFKDKLTVT